MSKTVYDYMDWPEIEAVVYGEETAPRDVMGPRLTPDGVLIQGFFPEARAVAVVIGRKKYEMELEDEAGYYAVLIPGRKIPDYEFQIEFEKETKKFKDAYAFGGLLTEDDERAFLGGVYYEAYKKMGAHPMVMNGVAGTHFAGDYILTLTDGGGLTVQDINSEVGLYFEYTGQLNYLGTNGEGMVFGYHLNENAGTVRYGAFTLLRGSDGLHVKSVAGENFFDAPSGRYTVFARG